MHDKAGGETLPGLVYGHGVALEGLSVVAIRFNMVILLSMEHIEKLFMMLQQISGSHRERLCSSTKLPR